jgi:hypothetical protein
MKKFTIFILLNALFTVAKAQGLQAVIVERYYQTNAADSADAADNGSSTILRAGSITYRVFLDLAPGYKFLALFGNQDALGNPIHPLIIKTTTDFYNDPTYGQLFPQSTSLANTRKNTTLIDSYLTIGGVCAGKMAVLKTEDTDGSIGNTTGILANNPGGLFGAPINSVNPNAKDGLLPGIPQAPSALGLGTASDVFDQTAGNTFSTTNGVISSLGGVKGVTPSNMMLIGQFTTKGQLTFSLNVQIKDTLTNNAEVYVPSNPTSSLGEILFPSLSYTSPAVVTPTGNVGIQNFEYADEPIISVFPNPTKSHFTLEINNVKAGSMNQFQLVDVTGRKVLVKELDSKESNFSLKVNLSDFAQGIYFLSVTVEGKTTTRKIIKE